MLSRTAFKNVGGAQPPTFLRVCFAGPPGPARLQKCTQQKNRPDCLEVPNKRAPIMFEDPAGNLRFSAGFGPKVGPKQAQNIRHGANRNTTIPAILGRSARFDDHPKRLAATTARSGPHDWMALTLHPQTPKEAWGREGSILARVKSRSSAVA